MENTLKIIVDTTLSENKTLTFESTQLSNYIIDWGDGSEATTGLTHTYSSDGIYTITIYDISTVNFQIGLSPRIATTVEVYSVKLLGNTNYGGLFAIGDIDLKFFGSIKGFGSRTFTNAFYIKGVYVESIEQWLSIETPMSTDEFNPLTSTVDFYVDGQKLVNLEIPRSITVIPERIFLGCKSIEKVYIPNTVSNIKESAFNKCNNIKEIIFEDGGNVTLGMNAFKISYMQSNRTNIIALGNSVKQISNGCFAISGVSTNVKPALNISFSSAVQKIVAGAFSGYVANLSHVYYLGTQEQWNTLLTNVGSSNQAITNGTLHLVNTLTYHPSLGTLDPDVDNPSFVSDLPDPLPSVTATNWIVGGWYYDRLFTNPATPGDVLSGDADLYIKLYNDITYDLDGGVNSALNPSVYTSSDVTNRKLLFAPMKIGYDFDGWYLDSAFSSPVEDMSDFDGSAIALYAKFVDHYFNVPMRKTENGVEPAHLDAYSVRGNDPYASINISSINTMEELYIKINTINAKNEHAYFDMSSHIPGAYVCLINIQDVGNNHYCEINDLLHNRVYYAYDGFTFTEDIDEYIERCLVKDNYVSIKISGLSNMGEMVEYINRINSNNDHAFFDFSEYIDNAHVCTIQCFTQSSINYCFVFDILGGKLYGRYTGYSDSETITDYVNSSEAESDIVHAIRITDPTITILKIIQLLNRVNQIGHHVFFDVSAISSMDYLISFTSSEDGDNTSCTAMGIVKGTIAKHTYATADLATTTLSSLLESGAPLGGMQLDLLWTNPNPASDFAAQTINLDTTQYKMVMIVFRWHKNQSHYLNRSLCGFREYTVSENLGESLATRIVKRTQTGFTFTTGRGGTIKSIAELNTVSENHGSMIPIEIYGIN